jgi:hypothetical protein
VVSTSTEELPQVVRHVVGTCDLVGDHHEADRRVLRIHRPEQGASVGMLGGFA